MFKWFLMVALLAALVVATGAQASAQVKTKDQAFRTARACLMNHGARFVGRRGDGGGFVFFKAVPHIQYWTYHTMVGLVDSVTYYAFPGLPGQQKHDLVACVKKGI